MCPAFTFYGVSHAEIDEICRSNHGVNCEKRDIPRYCINSEEKERYQSEKYGGSMYQSYDLDSGFCCYYVCLPDLMCSPRRSKKRRTSSCDGGGSNCDAGGGDDCGGAGILIVLFAVVAIIALLIALAPAALALTVVVADLFLAGLIFLFDLLTLGIFHRYLTRTRVFIDADEDTMAKIFYDVARFGGLPRVRGFWSEGFTSVRYGAVGTIVGIVVAIITYLLEPSTRWWYMIPVSIIVISIVLLYTGTYNVKKRRQEVMQAVSAHFSGAKWEKTTRA